MRPPAHVLFGRGSSSQPLASNRRVAPPPAADPPLAPPPAAGQPLAPPPAAGPPLAPPPAADPPLAPPPAAEIALQRRYSRVLHPARLNGAKWFGYDTEVSTCVRTIIQGNFQGPWYSWRRVPLIDKEAWFSTFKTRFEWDDAYEPVVKANFAILAANRLRGMVSLAKARGAKPEWILLDHWREMLAYWATPQAVQRSAQARASRMFDRDGSGAHRHRAGSRSYAKVQDALAANNEDCSFLAVMKKTHQKPDGSYIDNRAREIAEKFDEHVEELLSEMESSNGEPLTVDALTVEERNEIYVKIAGMSKQRRVFGLGSLQLGINSLSASAASSQAVENTGTLTREVEELKNELQKSREENVNFRKRFETMEQIVQSLSGKSTFASSSLAGASATTPP